LEVLTRLGVDESTVEEMAFGELNEPAGMPSCASDVRTP
jgi:hypothetical protein